MFLTERRIDQLDPHDGAAQALGVFVSGDDAEQTATAIREAFPGLVARTGDARGDVEFLDSGAARSMLVAIGSAFVGTCILVAMFIVAGTLSLSVQSRRRDYALLRAVGASPSQVHSLVAREVLWVSAGRCAARYRARIPAVDRAAVGLRDRRRHPRRLRAQPSRGPRVRVPHPLVLASAWGAARIAASRVAKLDPVEALRESATGAPAISLTRIIIGIVVAAAGISVSTVPLVLRGQIAAGAAAGAAMLLIIALAVLGPWLVSLSVRLIGSVLRRLSSAGFLASANAAANSRRLASAILPIALGIGLGLVQIGAPSIIAAEAATQATARCHRRPAGDGADRAHA